MTDDQSRDMNQTGREPSLPSDSHPRLTGLEPALGTGTLLVSSPQIAIAGVQVRLGSRRMLNSLIITLRDGNSSQRVDAAWTLAGIKRREAEEAIITSINDPQPIIRMACATALGRIGTERVLAPLSTLLEDDDAGVQERAVRAITNIALKNEDNAALVRRVVRELIIRLNDRSAVTQEVAAVMLGWIGGAEAAVALANASASSRSQRVRSAAQTASLWAVGGDHEEVIGTPLRQRYRNPIAAGWVIARQVLPSISVISNLLIASAFVVTLSAALWYGTVPRDEVTMIPQTLSLPAIILMPLLTYILSWRFASQYRHTSQIQMLKIAPLSKTMMHWGYVLASLYRLRLPLAVIWAMTFQDVLRSNQSYADVIVNWMFSALFLVSNLYLAFIGTVTAIEPKTRPFFPLLPIVTALLVPGWWLCYGMILMTPDLTDAAKANWIIQFTIALVIIMAGLLYRVRNDA